MSANRSSQPLSHQETQRQRSVPCKRSQRHEDRPRSNTRPKWNTASPSATPPPQKEPNKTSHSSGSKDKKRSMEDLNQPDKTEKLIEEVNFLKQTLFQLVPKMNRMESVHEDLVPRLERMESVVSNTLNTERVQREVSRGPDNGAVSDLEETVVKELNASSLEGTPVEAADSGPSPSQPPSPVRSSPKNTDKKQGLAGHSTERMRTSKAPNKAMTEDQKKVLKTSRIYLIKQLDITGTLLDYFIQENILKCWHQEKVNAKVTTKDKITTFLDIIQKMGSRAFDALLEFLRSEDGQPHVADYLENQLNPKVVHNEEVRVLLAEVENIQNVLQLAINNYEQQLVNLIQTYVSVPKVRHGSIIFTLQFASVCQLDEYWMVMNNPQYRAGLMKQLMDLVMTDELRQLSTTSPLSPAMEEMTMDFKEYMKIRRELTKGYNLRVKTSECLTPKKRVTTYTTQDILHTLEYSFYNMRAIRRYRQRKAHVPLVDDSQRVAALMKMLQEKQHLLDEKESKFCRLVEDHVDKEMALKKRVRDVEQMESEHQQEVSRLKQELDIEREFAQEYKAEKEKLEKTSNSSMAQVESLQKELDEKEVELVQLRNTLNLTKQRSDGQTDRLSHENKKLKENVIELQKRLDHHAKLVEEPLAIEKQLQIEMKHKEADFRAALEQKDEDLKKLQHQLEQERELTRLKDGKIANMEQQTTRLNEENAKFKRQLQLIKANTSGSKPPSYEETMGESTAVLPETVTRWSPTTSSDSIGHFAEREQGASNMIPERMGGSIITPRETGFKGNTDPQASLSREALDQGLDGKPNAEGALASAPVPVPLNTSPNVNSKQSDSPTIPKSINETHGETSKAAPDSLAAAVQQDGASRVKFERPDTEECTKSRELDTVFCIDCSESMGEEGLNHVKQAFMTLIDDMQHTAHVYGLEENIGIVTFGGTADRVQSLTCNYKRLRRITNILAPRGGTPMVEAITEAQKEVAENGGKLRLSNRKVPSRIVVFTDGYPHNDDIVIDDRSKSQSARMRVMSAVCVFAKNPKKHGVAKMRVDFVACGVEYEEPFLKSLASNGTGVYARYDDAVALRQISGYYRWNYYASRFAGPFRVKAHIRDLVPDKSSFKNWMISNDTSERHLLDLEDPFELEECYKVVMAIAMEEGSSKEEEDDDSSSPSLSLNIPLGSRVVYVGDEQNNPKHRGTGTVVKHHQDDSITVEWDLSGLQHRYDFGKNKQYEVMTTTDPRVIDPNDPFLKVGVRVERGQDWKWANQDGGVGNIGTVYRVEDSGHVYVRWPNGHCNAYRHGSGGKYDLQLVVGPESTHTASLPLELAAEIRHVWQKFDNESNCFKQFDENTNAMLEILFNDNRQGCTEIEIDGEQYNLNFDKMEASNANRTIVVTRSDFQERNQEEDSGTATGKSRQTASFKAVVQESEDAATSGETTRTSQFQKSFHMDEQYLSGNLPKGEPHKLEDVDIDVD